ncbi:MAG: hypothetical protein HBSAPP04_13690 [Ignavibacteriaceae bacterium]|nr:MAG: hypothetical protein HBSAPP04_13690 [Ignavibacteriaceae bacterium]
MLNVILTVLPGILIAIISGSIGYLVGLIKTFRDGKQKAYSELLPPILKMAYDPKSEQDEKEFSAALAKLWLYGSKDVVENMKFAISIINDSRRGNSTEALQKAVISMRKDIQPFFWQRLKDEDVKFLYTKLK